MLVTSSLTMMMTSLINATLCYVSITAIKVLVSLKFRSIKSLL